MKRLMQPEQQISSEEFGLVPKTVRHTVLKNNSEPRTCENDIEIVVYRCMGWFHLHPNTRPVSLDQLWISVSKMCCCTYVVDPKVILFHLILNNYLSLDGEGDKQTINVCAANRFDSDGLRIFVPDEPMFSGIDSKVSADFTLTLCKVIHWLASLHAHLRQNSVTQQCMNINYENGPFRNGCNENNLFGGYQSDMTTQSSSTGFSYDDDEMRPEYTPPASRFSPTNESQTEFENMNSSAFSSYSEPWRFTVLLCAFMDGLAEQCIIRKNVNPQLIIEHFQCRGLIHLDGASGFLEYHLPPLPPKPIHYMALPSEEFEVNFPSGR